MNNKKSKIALNNSLNYLYVISMKDFSHLAIVQGNHCGLDPYVAKPFVRWMTIRPELQIEPAVGFSRQKLRLGLVLAHTVAWFPNP